MNRKTLLSLLTLAGLLGVPEVSPALKDYRVFDWTLIPHVLDFQPRNNSTEPLAEEMARLRPDQAVIRSSGVFPIDDPGHALDPFYEALLATEQRRPGAVTRIVHYGDSPTTADLITADARALLQGRFGDAGHGFCLVAKPWAWYEHRGLQIAGSGWKIDPANQADLRDGMYGLGAVSFRGDSGATSRITLRDDSHAWLEVSFLQVPSGGDLAVLGDGRELGVIRTSGPAGAAGFKRLAVPAGTRRFELQARGAVRLFGARFEKPGPGVVYNSLGVNGAYTSMLARLVNERHWADQLRHHKPDLIIINYGTNESMYPRFVDHAYEKETRLVIARIRAALPKASILLMSPMDRGQRSTNGEIITVPVLPRLVALQRQVAGETACAFFNTFEAMGGEGTMGRWYTAEPRLVSGDFIHPTPGGARIVGQLLYRAILDGFNRFKLRRLQQKFAKINE